MMDVLPIDAVLPEVVAAVRAGNLVLQAPTGTGKTTRVPPALIDAGLRVVMLEPRRIAARAAARRMAEERGTPLGGEIGYQVRFDRKAGRDTRALVVTEGLLVRMLQDDPFLEGFDVVVLDEVHERSLDADLALAMVRRVQRDVRPDLRVVAMSATLDAEPIAAFLDAATITTEGRRFPVDVRFLPYPWTGDVEDGVARLVVEALASTGGDVLAFLPGAAEIRRTIERLPRDVEAVPLYGALPPEEQDRALRPGRGRRVVVATNVAETSLTVPGVTAVVDSGFAKVVRQDPASGLDRLETSRIGRASADQRAGRAGRVAPGVAFRMWSAREHAALADREVPEIRRVDLAGPVLELMCWGERDVRAFPWFEAPTEAQLAQAEAVLRRLGALADGVTPLGRAMARLPLHPRLSRLVLEGARLGHLPTAALAAAILAERDVAPREGGPTTDSDVVDRVEEERRRPTSSRRAAEQIERAVGSGIHAKAVSVSADEAVRRAVLAGWPDRVARRREPGSPRGVMVGGRGVVLDRKSAVRDAELFVCVDVDAGDKEALVRAASAVDEGWLDVREEVATRFDEASRRVVAVRRRVYEDLVLSEQPAKVPEDAAEALAAAAEARLADVVPEDVRPLLARLRNLRTWMPELGLPEADDGFLIALLPRLCQGKRSLDELRNADWEDAIKGALPWKQREALDREAPERVTVPSGSSIRLAYEDGRPPVLAVKIQELFGLPETPRVAGGRVRVLLHLLAPNGRPQQVTDDLGSFWRTTWVEVRKELRGRYPRHSWPEDPWNAPPERRPKRRS